MANNESELVQSAEEIGFPVLLRPSYVIGGQGMEIHSFERKLIKSN